MLSHANLSWLAVLSAAWMAVSFHGCSAVLPYSPSATSSADSCEHIWGLPMGFKTGLGVRHRQVERWQLNLQPSLWQVYWWNGQPQRPNLLYGNGNHQWVMTGYNPKISCLPQVCINHRLSAYRQTGALPKLIVIESQPENILVEYTVNHCRELYRVNIDQNGVHTLQYFSYERASRRRWIELLANARYRLVGQSH